MESVRERENGKKAALLASQADLLSVLNLIRLNSDACLADLGFDALAI